MVKRQACLPGAGHAAEGNKIRDEAPEAGNSKSGGGVRDGGRGWGPKAEGIHAPAGAVHGFDSGQADDIPHAGVHCGLGAAQPDGGTGAPTAALMESTTARATGQAQKWWWRSGLGGPVPQRQGSIVCSRAAVGSAS